MRAARGIGAAAAVLLIAAGCAVHPADPPSAAGNGSVALAPVVQGPLTSQQQVSGSVQYLSDYAYASGATSYPVVNQAQGVLTALPALGGIVSQGQALYSVDGSPVLLLYGPVPAFRTLSLGLRGQDVAALNADLVALGDASTGEIPAHSDAFTAATAAALSRLQQHTGLAVTGQLPLGEALFLPGAVRIASVDGTLGASVAPGQTVVHTTSSAEEVVAEVDPSQAEQLQAGQPATITFADGQTAPGTIKSVAKVATSSSGGNGGGGAPTVEVDIAPKTSTALHGLENASVTVSIITASVKNALAVPVTALLAQAGGGYAVETASHAIIPVKLGIFDDAAGLVQVTGSGLTAGEQVVVAGT